MLSDINLPKPNRLLDDIGIHDEEYPIPHIDIEIDRRIHNIQSVDPDPYCLHRIPFSLRLHYIEEYLLTGK
jgi:hypothetical protein